MDVVKQETPNGNVNNPKNEISPVQSQQNPGGPKGNNKFQGGNNNQQNNQLNRKNMGNNNNNKFNNRGGKMNNVVNRNPNIKSEVIITILLNENINGVFEKNETTPSLEKIFLEMKYIIINCKCRCFDLKID